MTRPATPPPLERVGPDPALTIADLVAAGASPSSIVALSRVREAYRWLGALEAEIDRQALSPVTAARFRELERTSSTLAELSGCLIGVRTRLEEVK